MMSELSDFSKYMCKGWGERPYSVGQNESSLYCIMYLLSKLNFLEQL